MVGYLFGRAFPCWDEPAVKATFSVTMIVAVHLTALSNMPEKTCVHLASSPPKKKIVFHTSPKMSTYLLAWAVGTTHICIRYFIIVNLSGFVST